MSSLSLIQATIISHQNKCNNFLTHIPASTLSLTTPSPPNEQEWPHKNWTADHITLQHKTSQELPIALHKKSKALFMKPRLAQSGSSKCLLLYFFTPLSHPSTFSFSSPNTTNSVLPPGPLPIPPSLTAILLQIPTLNILHMTESFSFLCHSVRLSWPTI